MQNNISLEQALQSYRVMNTPTEFSWKQHWVKEKFSDDDLLKCTEEERLRFAKRLEECDITICNNIKQTQGITCTLKDLIRLLVSKSNKDLTKINRKVLYSTSNGERPIGKKSFELWNGFQVIDMDIKNDQIANSLKDYIFNKLKRCNWFLGVVLSSSGQGLHIYTKIAIADTEMKDIKRKKLLYLTNFRHKYSFVYLACVSAMKSLGFSKDDILKWMDLAMFKPQQGAFIGYDKHPLINTNFFEDFIYVNFDTTEDFEYPNMDWVTYPDLKAIFSRWEWFEREEDPNIEVVEAKDLDFDTHNKIHYKHYERWRLANTLVKLYGIEKGFKYLRIICSNNIKDKELQADCITANRHDKPVDIWAVNRLNTYHGFKIKLNIDNNLIDEADILNSINNISNPNLIKSAVNTKEFFLKKNEYLGNIKNSLIKNCGRLTLIEAGAGVGKTEMVKLLASEGKKVMMVMPFTSTIKSKVESDPNWDYSYGGKTPNLDTNKSLSLTIDKFSYLNLMDVKTAGFDYIFIDESHLLFQSEYRPVMSKVVEMIRNTEVPIILMSGTPSGEIVFFPDIIHIKVTKEDIRKKEFKVNIVDSPSDVIYFMCKQMAKDISEGKRILFPTNKGTLYSKQIKAAVTYFLQNDYMNFEEVRLKYYKKSNLGDDFMEDINFQKTVKNTQILLCTNYLSVGVDILDKFNFQIYFTDLILAQEIEQFANRLRSNDLFINLYISKNDSDGNPRNLHKYKEVNFKLNDEEIKNVHSILRLCNSMIERNPVEYKYNTLIASIIHDNKFIEYNDIENKYFLNEITYKLIYFERKYREYAQQLPVVMRGMMAYGYQVSAMDLGGLDVGSTAITFRDLKSMVKLAYDEQLQINTNHIEELINLITDDRLGLYKEVLRGKFELRKGNQWKEDITKRKMYVKNIEAFEKVVPIFLSMSKQYEIKDIKEIFEFCRNTGGSYNFSAINRIRLLINLLYNDKNNRLDIPIKDYMNDVYKFSEKKSVSKKEIDNFIQREAEKYANQESKGEIMIIQASLTMDSIKKTLEKIFKCMVNCSGKKVINMHRVELLWKEKEYYNSTDQNDKVYIIEEFLNK